MFLTRLFSVADILQFNAGLVHIISVPFMQVAPINLETFLWYLQLTNFSMLLFLLLYYKSVTWYHSCQLEIKPGKDRTLEFSGTMMLKSLILN